MAKTAVQAKKDVKKPQHPQQRKKTAQPGPARLLLILGAVGLLAVAGIGIVLTRGSGDETTGAAAAAPLPNTSDYHSLLVSPNAPDHLVLGTHQGLFRSVDGGRSWTQAELVNQDAMNLARASSRTVWAAGHNVLARSRDGGSSWQDVQPTGLPSLDLHGFTVDPRTGRLWAAVAGRGLYRSDDGGASFELVTSQVGAGVFGLELLPGGRLLAADMQQQALVLGRNGGRQWSKVLDRPVLAIAASPANPNLLLASILGKDAGIVRSSDGGRTWTPVLALPEGTGPIAFSESSTRIAYAVGLDRTLYRSADAGASWIQVSKEVR